MEEMKDWKNEMKEGRKEGGEGKEGKKKLVEWNDDAQCPAV